MTRLQQIYAQCAAFPFGAWAYTHRLKLTFYPLYALLSAIVLLHFIYSSQFGDAYYRTRFDAMLNGTAWKPFVYRILVPETVGLLRDATPSSVERAVNESLYDIKFDTGYDSIRAALPWLANAFPNKDTIYERLLALALQAVAWGVFLLLLRRLAFALFPNAPAVGWCAPVLACFAFPCFSMPWQYIYDIPLLALHTACFYFLLTQKWRLYIASFILACLNKETSIYVMLFFCLWSFNRVSAERFSTLLLMQCFIFILIKISITMSFIGNAGWLLEDNFNLQMRAEVFTKFRHTHLLNVCLMAFLLTYQWMQKPAFLKTSLWLLPVVVVGYLFFGNAGEWRIIFDILPLLLLLVTHTLVVGTGVAASPVFATRKE